jgi:hypothetical protein
VSHADGPRTAPIRSFRVGLAAIVLGAAPISPLCAHHSAVMFDTSRDVTIEGVVTRYDWKNPHVYMAVESTAPDGTGYEQQIEAGASSVLSPLGLTEDSVALGDRVTVRANPNRRGEGRIVLGRDLVKADGTVLPLFIGSASARKPIEARAESLEGVWFSPRTAFFDLNQGRRSWTLTEAGRAAAESFDSTQTAHADCIPVTAPTLMVYPVATVIAIEDDRVVFDVDWMTSQRVVYTDGRGHPENGERTLHGHSIGSWEDQTLVVDTTQFADHKEGLAIGLPSGPRKHLIERFSLIDDGQKMRYEVTLEDPDYLAEPMTYSAELEYRPDLEPTGLACDLDVAQRFLNDE